MIGIVIVSHSAKLAEGVIDLVDQMTQGQVPVATAGGIDDLEEPIGTDALQIKEAIEEVFSDDGVLVLMDLGSAILSAEMAKEFFSEEQQAKIYLCSAPLVEGAITAAVEAIGTNDIKQIITAALGGLTPKQAELQDIAPETTTQAPRLDSGLAQEIRLTVRNRLGLHARPAAKFVSTASGFESDITVRNATKEGAPVSAKSINQVATIGARQGHEIAVAAQGPDAGKALQALQVLVEANFGEKEDEVVEAVEPPTTVAAQSVEGQIIGIAASPGVAIGPAALFQLSTVEVLEYEIEDPDPEWERLQHAIQTAKREIQALKSQTQAQAGQAQADIFEAHRLYLEDPSLVEAARQKIFDRHVNAEAAWQATVSEIADKYKNLDDPYLQARAADVADVGGRVFTHLTGTTPMAIDLSQPAILVASDLTPSDAVQLDRDKVLGICTKLGSATSHSAILARAMGIPAVVGVGPNFSQIEADRTVVIDGTRGQVWVEPESKMLADFQAERDNWVASQTAAKAASQQPAATKDGKRIEVVANIGGVADAKLALENGAEGVGLFRTEFLFLNRSAAPSEEEQFEAYQAVAEALGKRPLVIRTLDIGGDKFLPYMQLESETNPFLGWRGIRICLDWPNLFKTQLRAILRASPGHQIKIMFPMISSMAEVRSAKVILEEVRTELRQAGTPFDENLQVGIMIEVPAAVAISDHLAAEVDFFSIGTNDLSQYVTASDRMNAKVAALADTFHPGILRMIAQTIRSAHAAGIWVGLCGEFASNSLATPILLGMGIDEFSLSAPSIPEVKKMIGQLQTVQTEAIASAVLNLDSAAAVREYVKENIKVKA